MASTELIEVARYELRRALVRELPGPDPNRGAALEQAITQLILAILADAVKPKK